MRNFENWETQDLELTFGLERTQEMEDLKDWLQATTTLNPQEKAQTEELKEIIFRLADYWNEDELKLQCIAPLLQIVDYKHIPKHRIFSQRPLSATINGIEIGGRVDFMLAKGEQKPMKPYFFIHEYKQESKKGSADAKGQLLAELLAAQTKNEDGNPMYGCYVIGRHWFFVILKGKNYAVSRSYDASQGDIYQIIAILRKIKDYILAQI